MECGGVEEPSRHDRLHDVRHVTPLNLRTGPIKVYFTVGEPQYLAFRKRYPTDATREKADKNLHLQLILADGSTYPHEGKFDFADRQVNVSTGAIRLAALFPNPGTFCARVATPGSAGLSGSSRVRCCFLNARCRSSRGYQVAVADSDNKVSIRTVAVGDPVGNKWVLRVEVCRQLLRNHYAPCFAINSFISVLAATFPGGQ